MTCFGLKDNRNFSQVRGSCGKCSWVFHTIPCFPCLVRQHPDDFLQGTPQDKHRVPSSYWQFWTMHLEQGFVHLISANLPPAFEGPSKHNVSSFVPTLQHQPLAHRKFCLLGIFFQHQLPNGFWENLMSRWRRVKWLQLLCEGSHCQQNTPGTFCACWFFPGTAAYSQMGKGRGLSTEISVDTCCDALLERKHLLLFETEYTTY